MTDRIADAFEDRSREQLTADYLAIEQKKFHLFKELTDKITRFTDEQLKILEEIRR